MQMLENRMLIDAEWNEVEYRVPISNPLSNRRRAYEEEELGHYEYDDLEEDDEE